MKDKNVKKIIQGLARASFKDGKIVESQVVKSIKALKSLPTGQAIDALTQYLRELKFNQRRHTLYLETVISISPTQINKIKKLVEEKMKITKIVTQINPGILGGFKLTVGDEVWDESILAKVDQVKEAIVSGRLNSTD